MSDSRTRRRSSIRSFLECPIGLVVGLVLLLAATSASAQSVDIPAIMDPDVKAPPTMIALQYGHQFKADVEDDGTEIARDNVMLMGAHRFQIGENTSLFALGSYTLHAYDFSGKSGARNFYRWDDVHRMVIGALVGHDLNEKWRLIGGAIFRSWGEGGADYADSITGGVILGFNYQRNENYSVGLLVGAFSALEDKMAFMPIPTLKWNFAENWRWNVGLVSVFDPGVGTELNWQVSEKFGIGTGFAFQSRRYRLSDKTRVGTTPGPPPSGRTDEGGIGQETEIPVFAALKWKPTKRSSVDLLAGVALAGNVRVESSAGGRIKDHDYDPAPFVGLRGTFAF
jgi:hypothetical protein